MAEFRLSSLEGWTIAASRVVNRIALGGLARGVVASGLPQRLPQSYEQGLANAGTVVPAFAVETGALVAETLVDYRPATIEPIIYV